MSKLKNFIYEILEDLLFLAGLAFIAFGVYQIYLPAGHITTGAALVLFAYLLAVRQKRKGRQN